MSASITDKQFRRLFVSYFLLSCMIPLLLMLLIVYGYTVPVLFPGQLAALRSVFNSGLVGILLFQVLGFALLWWWVHSLEKLSQDIENLSSRHLKPKALPALKQDSELQRIGALIGKLNDELTEKSQQAKMYATQVRELSDKLTVLANTDALTQLYNRKCFEQKLADAVHRAEKLNQSFWLVRMEVERFTAFDEKSADKVLTAVAKLLRKELRGDGLPFRIARSEFAVIFARGDGPRVARTIHRFVAAVSALELDLETGLPVEQISMSCGIAGYRHSVEELCADAWRAMKTAQSQGRPIEVAPVNATRPPAKGRKRAADEGAVRS